MRKMKRIMMPVTLAAAIAIELFTGCKYRPLEDELHTTARIPVRIDWSASGVDVGTMHRASVILFPENGGAPLEYRLETNLTYGEIAVPPGVYSVLVFNETTDANDWSNIKFTGTDRYETFAAVALPAENRGFYARSDKLPLIKNPEPLAAWGMKGFEVTREMVLRTREGIRDIEAEAPALTAVKPLPRVHIMKITARVANLASSMQATGLLDGKSSGVYLASGERIPVPGTYSFILNGRVYDTNEQDGTTTCSFYYFGSLPSSTARYRIHLDFLLNDGTLHPRETYDVTGMISQVPGTIVATHILNIGYSVNNGDHLIELPYMDVGAGSITVDDWDEVIIPLQ